MNSMIKWTRVLFTPDPERVLVRFFAYGDSERIHRIASRIMWLSEDAVEAELATVLRRFSKRHRNITEVLMQHYEAVAPGISREVTPSDKRKLLIGAYFTSEYALESAALFNPSIVPHPDQSGVAESAVRFVLALRATGEGHVSSIEFREGVIDADGNIDMVAPGDLASDPEMVENPVYDKKVFGRKIYELGYENEVTNRVLAVLTDTFGLSELLEEIDKAKTSEPRINRELLDSLAAMKTLAEENYEMRFDCSCPLAERVVLPPPGGPHRAIEDARFVLFRDGADENSGPCYYATYTAVSDGMFLPQLLETSDFTSFKFITLNGDGAQNKGMALFPRKIKGKYVMLSRQDGEHLFVIKSDNIHFWHGPKMLMRPAFPWEYVQLGNCGSPIETSEGWLVLTHGVGAMRRYCIGAVLLDLDDPLRIIGRLKRPLLQPNENERDGYVPNVVYTCGGMIHNDMLVVPYGMADYASRIALVDLPELLRRLKKSPVK